MSILRIRAKCYSRNSSEMCIDYSAVSRIDQEEMRDYTQCLLFCFVLREWTCSNSREKLNFEVFNFRPQCSNPAGGIHVCLFGMLCVVRYWSLRHADHSSRGVLLNVVCLSVISKPQVRRVRLIRAVEPRTKKRWFIFVEFKSVMLGLNENVNFKTVTIMKFWLQRIRPYKYLIIIIIIIIIIG
jgi:hypothetical protein